MSLKVVWYNEAQPINIHRACKSKLSLFSKLHCVHGITYDLCELLAIIKIIEIKAT